MTVLTPAAVEIGLLISFIDEYLSDLPEGRNLVTASEHTDVLLDLRLHASAARDSLAGAPFPLGEIEDAFSELEVDEPAAVPADDLKPGLIRQFAGAVSEHAGNVADAAGTAPGDVPVEIGEAAVLDAEPEDLGDFEEEPAEIVHLIGSQGESKGKFRYPVAKCGVTEKLGRTESSDTMVAWWNDVTCDVCKIAGADSVTHAEEQAAKQAVIDAEAAASEAAEQAAAELAEAEAEANASAGVVEDDLGF